MGPHPGWFVVIVGGALVVGGLIWIFAPWVPLGRLPGDLRFANGETRVYIPITTCILLSVMLSGLVWLVRFLAR